MMMKINQLPPVPRGTFFSEVWRAFQFCLAKKNYARLQGRAGRLEYWSTTILGTLISTLPLFFTLIPCDLIDYAAISISLVLIFYLAMPMLAVYVRRLHDLGWSGWWIVLQYVTICVPFAYVVFALTGMILNEPDFLANPYEMVYILASDVHENGLFFVYSCAEFISIILFIITLLPGTKGLNKYDR